MKTLRIALAFLLLAASVPASAEHNLLILGKSWHFRSDNVRGPKGGFNQYNYGLGYEYQWKDSGWFAGGLTYRDSLRNQTYAGYAGYRVSHHVTDNFSVLSSLRVGYAHGKTTNGFIPLPTVGVQYGRVALELMYVPPGVAMHGIHTVGVFGRIVF